MASLFFAWFSEQERKKLLHDSKKLFTVLSFVLSWYVHGLDF